MLPLFYFTYLSYHKETCCQAEIRYFRKLILFIRKLILILAIALLTYLIILLRIEVEENRSCKGEICCGLVI